MARIEDIDRSASVDPAEVERLGNDSKVVDFEAPRDTRVTLPLDILEQANLATLVQVLRRPPEMSLSPDADPQVAGMEDVRAIELDPILFEGAGELSYKIASLVVRREAEVAASDNPEVMRGFEKMSQTLRMFEHLHMQRNGQSVV